MADYTSLNRLSRRPPLVVGPSLPRLRPAQPANANKPALTGRELAVTRGKGKKVGLKRQTASTPGKITLPPYRGKVGLEPSTPGTWQPFRGKV